MGMKAIATILAAFAAVTGICAAETATNTVALTDAEVGLVERSRAAKARAAKEAETANAKARTAKLARGAQTKATSSFARPRQMVPPSVWNRKRLIAMDAESVPGSVVYTWAQGTSTWCETNALKAIEFKAAKNRYSKLKIIVAAKAAGKWTSLKAGLEAADKMDEWNACQYIEDGDPSFVAATNAVVAAGIATADEIAAFLETAIDN